MDDETKAAVLKMLSVWAAGLLGMKLADWVLVVTLVYTVIQCATLVRDKWWRERKKSVPTGDKQ